ncbi:MAG: hypothetical protein WC794_04565 [Candidatus Doudnabacteria bacterium]|jgi:hypothetical protein
MFKETRPEREEIIPAVEKLNTFIGQVAEKYRSQGVPVRADGRIDMLAYKGIQPDVDADLAKNSELEDTWFKGVPKEQRQSARLTLEGEQLEMLAYGVFIKNLGKNFIVARASEHDDRINKADTVILDKVSGELICAFDEVGATNGSDFEEKLGKVKDRNFQGGAKLKYGIGVKKVGEKRTVMAASAENLPIFYIALPSDRIQKGIKEFNPDQNTQSDFEKNLFKYFVATLNAQIQGLKLYGNRLDPKLKERLQVFEKLLATLN